MKQYIIVFIVVFIGYLVGNSIYEEINKDKTPGKAKRLACQKEVTSFERSFSDKEIVEVQNFIKNGNIEFSSSVEKAVYDDSRLFDYVSLKNTDQIFLNTLQQYVTDEKIEKDRFRVSYTIYENDKKDPGKKTKKSKEYAGYVVLEARNSTNKVIYKVQIDFMDHKGLDLQKSIECSVKSLMTFKVLKK